MYNTGLRGFANSANCLRSFSDRKSLRRQYFRKLQADAEDGRGRHSAFIWQRHGRRVEYPGQVVPLGATGVLEFAEDRYELAPAPRVREPGYLAERVDPLAEPVPIQPCQAVAYVGEALDSRLGESVQRTNSTSGSALNAASSASPQAL